MTYCDVTAIFIEDLFSEDILYKAHSLVAEDVSFGIPCGDTAAFLSAVLNCKKYLGDQALTVLYIKYTGYTAHNNLRILVCKKNWLTLLALELKIKNRRICPV